MAMVLPATYSSNEIEVAPFETINGHAKFKLGVGEAGSRLLVIMTAEEFRAVIAKGADLLAAHDAEAAPVQAVA